MFAVPAHTNTEKAVVLDPFNGIAFEGNLIYEDGKITDRTVDRMLTEDELAKRLVAGIQNLIIPPFIDSHGHAESSKLTLEDRDSFSLQHGTFGQVFDWHELANVCGKDALKYSLIAHNISDLYHANMIPSCVPAAGPEISTSGAILTVDDIRSFLKLKGVTGLAEVMNYPGVIHGFGVDQILKIQLAQELNKVIDGHMPSSVTDEEAQIYYQQHGISTDHEKTNIEDALQAIRFGANIIVREGSAAKNAVSLSELFNGCKYPQAKGRLGLGTDDLEPVDLLHKGHIDAVINVLLANGVSLMPLLHAASVFPTEHYSLKMGLLRPGDNADFLICEFTDNQLRVKKPVLKGRSADTYLIENSSNTIPIINNFKANPIPLDALLIKAPVERIKNEKVNVNVISAIDGQLTTKLTTGFAKVKDGFLAPNTDDDILMMVVVNRYTEEPIPSIGFIKNFGLKRGAAASTVGHDDHNIVAVGTSVKEIHTAINKLIECKGGQVVVEENWSEVLALPIGGLMSDKPLKEVAPIQEKIEEKIKEIGSPLSSALMTLSFMSLAVIGDIKLTDKGLFYTPDWKFIGLYPS